MNHAHLPLKQSSIRSSMRIVNPSEVVLLEGIGNYTVAHLLNESKLVFSKTLKVYEEEFSSAGFIRIHRNTVLNPHYIVAFNKLESSFVLKNKYEVTISRRRLRELRSYLQDNKIPVVEQTAYNIKKIGHSSVTIQPNFPNF